MSRTPEERREFTRLLQDEEAAMTDPVTPVQEESRPVDIEQYEATQRWMRRQRMLSPFRSIWHRLLGHEVGRYACFTCDMDLPR